MHYACCNTRFPVCILQWHWACVFQLCLLQQCAFWSDTACAFRSVCVLQHWADSSLARCALVPPVSQPLARLLPPSCRLLTSNSKIPQPTFFCQLISNFFGFFSQPISNFLMPTRSRKLLLCRPIWKCQIVTQAATTCHLSSLADLNSKDLMRSQTMYIVMYLQSECV